MRSCRVSEKVLYFDGVGGTLRAIEKDAIINRFC